MMTRYGIPCALLLVAQTACTGSSHAATMRLGTTHTVEQSGALAVLDSLRPAPALRVVVASSGQILHAAANGDLDLIITHAPSLEQRLLIDAGRAALRCPFLASRFAIVGPPDDPARVAGAATAADAFRRIAAARATFISRGDSSGTHVKELALWRAAGVGADVLVIPAASRGWYVQAGIDQAATLRLADERRAYALADLPTLSQLAGVDLRVLFATDTALANPYTLYVIRSDTQQTAAVRFSTWAMADWRAHLLARRLPDGTAAFVAPPSAAGGCAVPATPAADAAAER